MKHKMKIMLVTPDFPLGGAEIMVENLSNELVRDGYDISLVSLYDYHSAITERLEGNKIRIFYLGKKLGLDLRMIFRLYKLYKKENPDIIHTHRYAIQYAVPAAVLAKVPVKIHTIHNIASKEVGFLKRKINFIFYRYFKVIPVSISPEVTKSVAKEYRLPDEQVKMIYNGIDFSKIITKKDYDDYQEMIRIIHIGRFSEQKNHIGLIESFKIVHDSVSNTALKLIGAGDLEAIIKAKINELDLEDSIEFLGLKSNVYPYYHDSDIFVLPSLWEGMPITVIEAMATGLPIVATAVGGVPDMIDDGKTGLLVDINKDQIAEALRKLAKDSNLRMRLGKAARDASVCYSSQEMARGYESLYRFAISGYLKRKTNKDKGEHNAEYLSRRLSE